MQTYRKVGNFAYVLILAGAISLAFLISKNNAAGRVTEISAFSAPIAGIALLAVISLILAKKLEEKIVNHTTDD